MPKYIVTGWIAGDWVHVVEAETAEEAREQVEKLLDDGDLVPEVDSFADLDVRGVQELTE